MRRFSQDVFDWKVLGSPSLLAWFAFFSTEGVEVSKKGLHSGLEVMVQEFQVTEILPDLNAELLACSLLLSWSAERNEFRDYFF